jgi:hypothetical protein
MSECSYWPDPLATERAILGTVLYSDLFDYPLTPGEIAHYLIGIRCDSSGIRARLDGSVWLRERIAQTDGFVTLRGREHLACRREERAKSSEKLWRRARIFIKLLSYFPFVRMIGVTGALSMDNSAEGDDVDVLIVTAPNRVWMTRALTLLLVYAGRIGGKTLCPNYLLSESVLPLEQRSAYIAHEFVQMVPLYGFDVYGRMRAANHWIEEILPNATHPFRPRSEQRPGLLGRTMKGTLEGLLSGRLGDFLEEWEMRRKVKKFLPKALQSGSSAILTRDQVKGHFEDHGEQIIRAYQTRLREFSLSDVMRPTISEAPAGTGSEDPLRQAAVCTGG